MKNLTFALIICLIIPNNSFSQIQENALPASAVITNSKAIALKEHKKILVIFHASWCVWCHRMDSAMNSASVKDFFQKNFVITHLTVDESKDKKNLENEGANEMRTAWHGDNQGIPYWVILDNEGKVLADSRLVGADGKPGNSVGCPAQPEEVDYFLSVLKKTTSASMAQLELVKQRFLKNK
ncbi:MAG: thioredoxin family protein [Bacteroidetes bacterium]|nr:thioredoxin family protein [Bacteroidota bacterium]